MIWFAALVEENGQSQRRKSKFHSKNLQGAHEEGSKILHNRKSIHTDTYKETYIQTKKGCLTGSPS